MCKLHYIQFRWIFIAISYLNCTQNVQELEVDLYQEATAIRANMLCIPRYTKYTNNDTTVGVNKSFLQCTHAVRGISLLKMNTKTVTSIQNNFLCNASN